MHIAYWISKATNTRFLWNMWVYLCSNSLPNFTCLAPTFYHLTERKYRINAILLLDIIPKVRQPILHILLLPLCYCATYYILRATDLLTVPISLKLLNFARPPCCYYCSQEIKVFGVAVIGINFRRSFIQISYLLHHLEVEDSKIHARARAHTQINMALPTKTQACAYRTIMVIFYSFFLCFFPFFYERKVG